MPREVAHGHIGCKALEQCRGLGTEILSNQKLKSIFLLGSITPDSGYYCLWPFIDGAGIAETLHGSNGSNSFELPKALSKETNIHTLAFSLGFISHILLDAHWHPMIFNLTGDYYDKNKKEALASRARHRRIEQLIDSIICKSYNLDHRNYFIKQNLNEIEFDLTKLDLEICNGLKINSGTFLTLWKWHANLQKTIFIRTSGKVFKSFSCQQAISFTISSK